MSPVPTTCNSPDRSLLYAEVGSNIGLRHPFSPAASVHFPHLICDFLRDLCVRSALQIHAMGYWFKMLGVHARRLSAEMVEFQSLGDGSVGALPGVSVSEATESSVPKFVIDLDVDVAGSGESAIFFNPRVVAPLFSFYSSRPMPLEKLLWLSLHPSVESGGIRGDRGIFTAATHAFPRWIGWINEGSCDSRSHSSVVPRDESPCAVLVDGHRRSTTTLAELWTRIRVHAGLLYRLTLRGGGDNRSPIFYLESL